MGNVERYHVYSNAGTSAAQHERRRKESSSGLESPKIEIADFALYARVRYPGVTPKLMATSIGSMGVVEAHRPHVFEIQNIVSGRIRMTQAPSQRRGTV